MNASARRICRRAGRTAPKSRGGREKLAGAELDLERGRDPAGIAGARRGGHQILLAARAQRARRLSDVRRGRRGALCRQGAQHQEAHRELYAPRPADGPHRADDRADRLDGFRLDRDRGRGAAARGQFHQADEAALQCAAARRQELSLYSDHRRSCRAAARSNIAARERARAIISARSPAPARSTAR